jgi:GTPase SAR1 family protein
LDGSINNVKYATFTVVIAGFNVEKVQYKNVVFTVWDVGGQEKLRSLWKMYLSNSDALVIMLTCNSVGTCLMLHVICLSILYLEQLSILSLIWILHFFGVHLYLVSSNRVTYSQFLAP